LYDSLKVNRFVAIDIGQLRLGMYVHLGVGWLRHPFPVNSFKITTEEQLKTLQSLKLSQIQFDPARSDPEVTEDAVTDKAESEKPSQAGSLENWRTTMQSVQERFQAALACFDAVQAMVPADLSAARARSDEMVGDYVTQLASERDISLHLMFEGGRSSASVHGLNTAVMSLLLGKALGMQDQSLQDLGVAALLHDLGKIPLHIPASDCVLNQMAAGTAQPTFPYAHHVGESVALTQAMGYAPSVTTAIAQHHEWADGSGFPLGLLAADMDMGGQILALVNNYERLCNPPTALTGMTPHEALASLYGQYRHRYAPEVLRALVQTLGVYPPGSWVELSDGSQGMVVCVNTRQALKPSVLVYKPETGQGNQQVVELAQQLELGIRRGLHKAQILPKALAVLQPNQHLCYFFDSSVTAVAEKVTS
jgi:HD-GYP domain-containing protein (c-di-GMP phosphodiesterase class II)